MPVLQSQHYWPRSLIVTKEIILANMNRKKNTSYMFVSENQQITYIGTSEDQALQWWLSPNYIDILHSEN